MKLKSLVTVAAVVTSGVVLARVDSTTTLCQIELANGVKDPVVALPLIEVHSGTNAINPSACVLTNGLHTGDYLYAIVGGNRKAWRFNETHGWETVNVTVGNITIPAAGNDKLERGSAVWLHRQGANKGNVYIYGQITNIAQSVTISGDFAMIGNATTDSYLLTAIPWGTKPSDGDKLCLIADNTVGQVEYTCIREGEAVKWGKIVVGTNPKGRIIETIKELTQEEYAAVSIAPGEGFVYMKNNLSADNPTINWPSGEQDIKGVMAERSKSFIKSLK